MPLDKISNMTFTQLHLDAYKRLRDKNSLRYTSEKEVQKVLGKKKRTKELADSEEGRKLYSKDKRWTHLPNLPKDKMDAHFQLADAQKNGDDMQQIFFEQVLKRIEQKEKQVMQMIKNQQIRQTIHEVNVRNKGLSVARMEIAALEAREKAKTEIMDKEYYLHSTRPSRPARTAPGTPVQRLVNNRRSSDTRSRRYCTRGIPVLQTSRTSTVSCC
mgnify:CR=1 FL=1